MVKKYSPLFFVFAISALIWLMLGINANQYIFYSARLDTNKIVHGKKVHRGNSPELTSAHLNFQPGRAPELWSVAMAKTLMARYPDYRRAYWKDWTYVQGYVLNGFNLLYNYTADTVFLNYIKRYIDHFVDERGNYSGDKLTNLDNICTGNIVVELYSVTHDNRYKIAAEKFLRAFDNYPRSDGEFWHNSSAPNMWAEGLFMGQIFLIRYGKLIGDSNYCFSEAVKQILTFSQHTRKDDSGLYFHGWSERPGKTKWADPLTGVAAEVCSEGLGWYSLILTETIASIPEDNTERPVLLSLYRKLADGLADNQDQKSGIWFIVVDKGNDPRNIIEPSGSAMFIYSLKKGIDLGLLDKSKFEPVVEKAYKGLLNQAKINEHGLVDIYGGIDGIPIKRDLEEYVSLPSSINAKEAVGGFLWASIIMEKQKLKKLK